MTTAIIISICVLLLIAYLFDLSSSKTRIPSVILLLILGWVVRQSIRLLGIEVPDPGSFLPALGTIGLIMIVLEGSLELEFNRSKIPVIAKSLFVATIPIIGLAFLLAYLFNYYDGVPYKAGLLNAIPFCVISSAIAIPSVKNLSKKQREFVTYESSLSDILGILFFNFLAYNAIINSSSFVQFGLQLLIITAISFIATIALAFLLSKIDHHIKFAPIVLLVILIYEISKVYNLPGLIFILLFGLFLGNLDELKRFKWIQKLKPEELNMEVFKFKELIVEGTFLIRSLFFLLFGYLIETAEIINTQSLTWALVISAAIIVIRSIILMIVRMPLTPLLFIAPRGLITILLFLGISTEQSIVLVNRSLIIQVIIITAFIMMLGLMFTKKTKEEDPIEETILAHH
ncbi:MAG TPA: cation:proton antiporter [Ferruginibacter sp.]|nr:cation:proton antiporter [Ferruginibacter sp.]